MSSHERRRLKGSESFDGRMVRDDKAHNWTPLQMTKDHNSVLALCTWGFDRKAGVSLRKIHTPDSQTDRNQGKLNIALMQLKKAQWPCRLALLPNWCLYGKKLIPVTWIPFLRTLIRLATQLVSNGNTSIKSAMYCRRKTPRCGFRESNVEEYGETHFKRYWKAIRLEWADGEDSLAVCIWWEPFLHPKLEENNNTALPMEVFLYLIRDCQFTCLADQSKFSNWFCFKTDSPWHTDHLAESPFDDDPGEFHLCTLSSHPLWHTSWMGTFWHDPPRRSTPHKRMSSLPDPH